MIGQKKIAPELENELVAIFDGMAAVGAGLDSFGHSLISCKACCDGECAEHPEDDPVYAKISKINHTVSEAWNDLKDLLIEYDCLPDWCKEVLPQQPSIYRPEEDIPF